MCDIKRRFVMTVCFGSRKKCPRKKAPQTLNLTTPNLTLTLPLTPYGAFFRGDFFLTPFVLCSENFKIGCRLKPQQSFRK